jgi:DNA processing protein
VGTREASAYGERIAARLAAAAVRAGLVVVSGLARGIDAAAHRAAMEAGGLTVAVMGPGVDVPYPAAHRILLDLVQQNGVAVSESEPGTKAYRGCFPRRNRIIAALSRVTVVVEAPFKSGAINTATQALEMGRTVAAVPGPIDDSRSSGTNLLIRDGAQVITCEADLLTLCGLSTINDAARATGSVVETGLGTGLSQPDWVLLRSLGASFTPVHEIAFQSGLSIRQVSDSLLRLEIAGSIEAGNGGYRRTG